jgi:seryl-tRNA synthetase
MNLQVKLEGRVPADSIPLLGMQLAYCDEAIIRVDLSLINDAIVIVEIGDAANSTEIERKVRRVAARTLGSGPTPKTTELHRVSNPVKSWHADLDAELARRRWVVELGQGIYALEGPAATLYRRLDEVFRELCLALGSIEAHYPALLRTEFLQRIRYFDAFPQYTSFASHLRPDVDAIDSFMERMRSLPDRISFQAGETAATSMILSPTVCYHIYDALSDREIPADGMKITASGNCYRWESKNLSHLRRLWEFTMRELVVVGSKDLVLQTRERALAATLELCRRFELDGWVENANDPFFSTDASTKSAYQKGYGMKWELRLPVDDRGASIAVASFNNMQRTFGDACAIRLAGNGPTFSGCIGWGLERWVYAILAQRGLDPARWPAELGG